MTDSVLDYVRTGGQRTADPDFPHAPAGWSRERALEIARGEGLILDRDHWEVVSAIQGLFDRAGEGVRARELHDALDERFHARGGIKYVYELFPGGPIAQGCRVAGLQPPAGAADQGFGSVM
ncbi:MAG: TusE/DsrC/DsvC family sulfur relay protein [Gammaproteobacteria bacterium]